MFEKYNVCLRVFIDDAEVHSFIRKMNELPMLGHEYIIAGNIFAKVTRIINFSWDYRFTCRKALLAECWSTKYSKINYLVDLTYSSEVKRIGDYCYEYFK